MKNKLLTVILITLVTITLVGIIVLALVWQFNKDDGKEENEAPSIDEIIESLVEVPEITTNLADKKFIRVSLTIQTDNPKAAEELEKREFQVKNIALYELSELRQEDLEGKPGKQAFEESLKSQLNPLMQSGEIEKVSIVSYMIQ